MPTLDEWQNALLAEKEINVISNDHLVHTVNQRPNSKSHTGLRKTATIVPQIYPQRLCRIMPLELLGAMGLITTPRIDNLVDLCSTWARIRYIWAFNPEPVNHLPTSHRLRLSQESADIDFHQKTLLSDEIGMGMAALIMDKYLDAYNPIDVDVALRQSSITGLTQLGNASPDFIFQSKVDNSFLIVECKGTRSGYDTAMRQLQRGTEQVRALRFPTGITPSYVIATETSESYTNVYVVDPPPDDLANRNNKNEIVVFNEAAFRRAVRETQVANVLKYIGAFGQAYSLEHEQVRKSRGIRVYDPPNEVYVEELQSTFIGTRQELRVPGEYGLVSVFQGVSQQLYNALTRQLYDEAESIAEASFLAANRIVKKTETRINPGIYSFLRDDNVLRVRLFRREGTVLQIEIGA